MSIAGLAVYRGRNGGQNRVHASRGKPPGSGPGTPSPTDGSLLASLHHNRVTAPGSTPSHWMILLHGIFGAGRNWNRVARDLVTALPEWGVIPVDLRAHGRSETGTPPHTLSACVDDLMGLISELGLPIEAVLGHSFGGKVALLLGDRPEAGIERVFVIDSTPDARPPSGSAWAMLKVLRDSPGPFAERSDGIAAVESHGYANPVARWMATNLVSDDDGALIWRLDPDVMEALLMDFFETDAWPVIEAAVGPEIHMVRASESSLLTPEAIERIESAGLIADRVWLHHVEGGHWLNADNPEALNRLLVDSLS